MEIYRDFKGTVGEFINSLTGDNSLKRRIENLEVLPARKGISKPLPSSMHPQLAKALSAKGISSLYSHQLEAWEAYLSGKSFTVNTGTASGKSICYQMPVFHEMLCGPRARALMLFPTKALARDQLRSIRSFRIGNVNAEVYDGDTESDLRPHIRKNGRIILSNPDMLHHGILSNHRLWQPFFSNLSVIVLDEAHIARGVFGSNISMILRRLRRICSIYRSEPQFILASATIANAREHSSELTGIDTASVEEDTSPCGRKFFIFWNAPFDKTDDQRRSSIFEALRLAEMSVKRNLRTIVFSNSRKIVEVIAKELKGRFKDYGDAENKIAAYRGGYSPTQRRAIERDLFEGNLLCVTATNALELGIDIGMLDICIIVGYPGTISSTWQQAGRAGRRSDDSAAFLIAQDNPLDQYFMRHPEEFFGKPFEEAILSTDNPLIVKPHLACAAAEHRIEEGEGSIFTDNFESMSGEMVKDGILARKGKYLIYTDEGSPHQKVGIRSIHSTEFMIIESCTGEVLGTMDYGSAFYHIYPDAVYLHMAETYIVENLDLVNRIAMVKKASVKYYTQPRDIVSVTVIAEKKGRPLRQGVSEIHYGDVEVYEEVHSYVRKSSSTNEIIDINPLDLPPVSLETKALWYTLNEKDILKAGVRKESLAGGLHAAEHTAIAMLPAISMCDRWDIGGLSTDFHEHTSKPTVFIYDAYTGGIGISQKGFERSSVHIEKTLKALRDCPCAEGCPSCIQSPKCGSGNEPLSKKSALIILSLLMKEEQFRGFSV